MGFINKTIFSLEGYDLQISTFVTCIFFIFCENLGFHMIFIILAWICSILFHFLFCKSLICIEFHHLHGGIQLKISDFQF